MVRLYILEAILVSFAFSAQAHTLDGIEDSDRRYPAHILAELSGFLEQPAPHPEEEIFQLQEMPLSPAGQSPLGLGGLAHERLMVDEESNSTDSPSSLTAKSPMSSPLNASRNPGVWRGAPNLFEGDTEEEKVPWFLSPQPLSRAAAINQGAEAVVDPTSDRENALSLVLGGAVDVSAPQEEPTPSGGLAGGGRGASLMTDIKTQRKLLWSTIRDFVGKTRKTLASTVQFLYVDLMETKGTGTAACPFERMDDAKAHVEKQRKMLPPYVFIVDVFHPDDLGFTTAKAQVLEAAPSENTSVTESAPSALPSGAHVSTDASPEELEAREARQDVEAPSSSVPAALHAASPSVSEDAGDSARGFESTNRDAQELPAPPRGEPALSFTPREPTAEAL